MKSRLPVLFAAAVWVVAGAGLSGCDTTKKEAEATNTTETTTAAPDSMRDYRHYGYVGTVRSGDLGRLGGGNIGAFGSGSFALGR